MGSKKGKIFLIFLVAGLVLAVSVLGTGLYYYRNPSAVKPVIERSVSRFTGTSFRLKKLSYSLKPLSIHARGLTFSPAGSGHGFHVEVPELIADFSVEGPFGKRTLVIRRLGIEGFSLTISHSMRPPRIRRGQGKPSLISRALNGLIAFALFRDIRIQDINVRRGEITLKTEDQVIRIEKIRASIDNERLIDISCGLRAAWPSKKIIFSVPFLKIATQKAISFQNPQIGCLLRAEGGTFQSPKGMMEGLTLSAVLKHDHRKGALTVNSMDLGLGILRWKKPDMAASGMRLQGKFKYASGTTDLDIEALSLTLKGLVSSSLGLKAPLDIRLNAVAKADLNALTLQVPSFDITISHLLRLAGSLSAHALPRPIIALELVDGWLMSAGALAFLPERTRHILKEVSISGPVYLKGQIGGSGEAGGWRWACDLKSTLKNERITYRAGKLRARARVTGRLFARGTFPDLKVSGSLKSDRTVLQGIGADVAPLTWALSFSGKYPVFHINKFSASVPGAKMRVGKRQYRIERIRFQAAEGRLNAERKSLSFSDVKFDSSLLKNLRLSISYKGGMGFLGLKGKETGLIESALSLHLIPSGWQISGMDRVELEASLDKDRILSFSGTMALQGLSFQNRDGSLAGEKTALQAELKGKAGLGDSRFSVHAAVKITKGEALYDRFYVDFGKNPLVLQSRAEYDLPEKHIRLSRLTLALQNILSVVLGGDIFHSLPRRKVHLQIEVPKAPLKPAFDNLVSEPFKNEKPFLGTLKVGGSISADLEFEEAKGHRTVTGHCFWHAGSLSVGHGRVSLKGVELALPVWYATDRHAGIADVLKGHLSIRSVAVPVIPEQALDLDLEAGPGSMSINAPTLIRVPGGAVRLGPVEAKDIFQPLRSIETSLSLETMDLNPLLSRLWPHPVDGTLAGRLGSINFRHGDLNTKGELHARVFGGEIVLSRIGASGLFTPSPVLRLSARFNDLDLKSMTSGTSFGKIEGVLRGYVKDLEIAYGQPQRFNLLLETVKKRGVRQRISVKAVDNIARIGGGSSPFMGLAGRFASLFKEFSYKKIGIRASLENDVFRINGTVKEGGKEYLVKRGGFSGVNVVNQNPDNRASFNDMVKRIRRVTASKTGPVIK